MPREGAIRLKADGIEGFGASDERLGFFGATPVVRPAAYTVTNGLTDRSYDADTVVVAELADVVATIIQDLKNLGLFQ